MNFLIKKLQDNNNIYGQKIKVIIASRVLEAGVSFFNIREVHIMDPWWNFSNIEQKIGRGMRRESHKMLDKKKEI